MTSLQDALAKKKEAKQYFTRTRRTGHQVGDKILRPNDLGEYFPVSDEEIAVFDNLVAQGVLFNSQAEIEEPVLDKE